MNHVIGYWGGLREVFEFETLADAEKGAHFLLRLECPRIEIQVSRAELRSIWNVIPMDDGCTLAALKRRYGEARRETRLGWFRPFPCFGLRAVLAHSADVAAWYCDLPATRAEVVAIDNL